MTSFFENVLSLWLASGNIHRPEFLADSWRKPYNYIIYTRKLCRSPHLLSHFFSLSFLSHSALVVCRSRRWELVDWCPILSPNFHSESFSSSELTTFDKSSFSVSLPSPFPSRFPSFSLSQPKRDNGKMWQLKNELTLLFFLLRKGRIIYYNFDLQHPAPALKLLALFIFLFPSGIRNV